MPDKHPRFMGLAYSVRDRLAGRWTGTQRSFYEALTKRARFLPLEFLPGRFLKNDLNGRDMVEEARDADWSIWEETFCLHEPHSAIAIWGSLARLAYDHDYRGFDPKGLHLRGVFSLPGAWQQIPMSEVVAHLPIRNRVRANGSLAQS